VYSIGYKFGQVTMIAVSAFSLGWAPLRYRIFERADAKDVYVRILNLFSAAAAFGVVVMSVFGDELVRVATTPAYFDGARVIPLVCTSYALYGIHLLVATGMGVTKKTLGLTVAVVVAAGVNLAANLLLIPSYGMMGAATATVLAYTVLVVATDRSSQRVYPIEYEWGKVLRVALSAGVIVMLDRLLQPSSLAAGIGLAAALVAVFSVFLVLSGGVKRSDVRAVRVWMSEMGGERSAG
jgi:O-antigen/teichoic acid export membrane protein